MALELVTGVIVVKIMVLAKAEDNPVEVLLQVAMIMEALEKVARVVTVVTLQVVAVATMVVAPVILMVMIAMAEAEVALVI